MTTKTNSVPQRGPHCTGCGTSIDAGARYCDACRKKDFNEAPKAAWELAQQDTPAYDREHTDTSTETP